MQCRYEVSVPNFTQFYKVRHVDNLCSSLVHECCLRSRHGATMLANKPLGIIWSWVRQGQIKHHTKIDKRFELRILKRPSSRKSLKTVEFVKNAVTTCAI